MKVSPSSGLNGFWGENGQGKTNILEALYFALRGKSFRVGATRLDFEPEDADTSECVGVLAPTRKLSSKISIELENERGQDFQCEVFHDPDGRWLSHYNGKKIGSQRLREKVPVVVFSPEDHALIRGKPELRRHFLDEVFADICPGYGEVLERFEKALKSRNEVLKKEPSREQLTELATWDEVFARNSVELMELRLESFPTFKNKVEEVTEELFRETSMHVNLAFEPNLSTEKWKTFHFSEIFPILLESRGKDLATGWTHRGPHRDDFKMEIPGGDARTRASQGQTRLLALSLRWAHAHWVQEVQGEQPLFFIDDLSSELDAKRREALLGFIEHQKGQLFITGTERSLVDSRTFSDYKHYIVNTGVCTPT